MPLTREAFETLLAALDRDRDRAGEKYEGIRRRLLKFFEWRGSRCPEDLADDTIDRVCRRIAEGEAIRAEEPAVYFYGVARNVLREAWDRERRWSATELDPAAHSRDPVPEEDGEAERRIACLQRCLAALPSDARQLLLRYYEQEKGAKIEGRRALADGLGIGLNALRIRMHRIRARLEACVRGCLESRAERDWQGKPPQDREEEHRG